MEELQDAIEDAQYVNAIATQEDGPRPVLAWEKPSPETMEAWESKKLASDPAAFDLPELLASAIGLFLFSSYIKVHHDDYLRMNFIEDIIRYKKARGKTKLEMGHRIANKYLNKSEESTPPSKTEIHECDLLRLPTSTLSSNLSEEANFKDAMDYPECSESFIGLKGSIREEVCKAWQKQEKAERLRKTESNSAKGAALEAAKQVQEGRTEDENTAIGSPEESALASSSNRDSARKSGNERGSSSSMSGMPTTESMRSLTRKFKSSASILRDDVFDVPEALVIESLKKDYWARFLESEEYTKLKNFMWYGDRRVVPDDFFVMRVLGRGGFGLVTGMSLPFFCISAKIDGFHSHFRFCLPNAKQQRARKALRENFTR